MSLRLPGPKGDGACAPPICSKLPRRSNVAFSHGVLPNTSGRRRKRRSNACYGLPNPSAIPVGVTDFRQRCPSLPGIAQTLIGVMHVKVCSPIADGQSLNFFVGATTRIWALVNVCAAHRAASAASTRCITRSRSAAIRLRRSVSVRIFKLSLQTISKDREAGAGASQRC